MIAGRKARRTLALLGSLALILYIAVVALRILYPLDAVARVRLHASEAGLDPALVCSLVRAESRFHPDAESSRGAIGLMQLMPSTAAWIAAKLDVEAYDLRDAETNLRFGTWYLRHLLDRFGRIDLALAAYNAGPSRVDEWVASGEKGYVETTAFVHRVLRGEPVYRFLLSAPILVQITPSLPF